jgi:acyl carrier protein
MKYLKLSANIKITLRKGWQMNEIREQLRSYILDNFLFGDDNGFDDTVSFLDTGIINSTGILELIYFLEERFSIIVKDEELIPENLDSISNLLGFLGGKLRTTDRGQ